MKTIKSVQLIVNWNGNDEIFAEQVSNKHFDLDDRATLKRAIDWLKKCAKEYMVECGSKGMTGYTIHTQEAA